VPTDSGVLQPPAWLDAPSIDRTKEDAHDRLYCIPARVCVGEGEGICILIFEVMDRKE
jgi:hypothetical protein